MSTTTEYPPIPVQAENAEPLTIAGVGAEVPQSRTPYRWPTLWALMIASTLPMLWVYVVGLWQLEHYQFFPMVFVVVAAMMHSRSDNRVAAPSGSIQYALLALGMVFNAISISLFSPWFAAVAFVLVLIALLLNLTEPSGRSLAIIALPLISLIRLPLNLDNALIIALQNYTTRLASWLLDLATVPHMISGNIIELVNRDLFVAEACSGIHSVFTLLFLASALVAYTRRPFWMAPFYWTMALLAAVLGNAFRVTIVSAAANIGVDWATGTSHQIVGYFTLAIAFGLLLSFDQFVCALFHPIQGVVFDAEGWTNPISSVWDRFIVGWHPEEIADGEVADDDHFSGLQTNKSPSVANTGSNIPGVDTLAATASGQPNGTSNQPISLSGPVIGLAITAVLLLVVSASWVTWKSMNARVANVSKVSQQLFNAPPNVFAGRIGAATVLGHEIARDSENPRLGDSADIWILGNNNWQGHLILSQSYSAWHELCVCYKNLDWQLIDRVVFHSTGNPESSAADFDDTTEYVFAKFRKSIGEHGYLLFSAITYDGKVVRSPATFSLFGQFATRIAGEGADDLGNLMMLQMWIESPHELSYDDIEAAKNVFCEAREQLVTAVRTEAVK